MSIVNMAQIVIALLLIGAILMQNRGGGLSGMFGGSGGDNVYMAKRGLEKKLFTLTIILSVMFFAVSLYVVI